METAEKPKYQMFPNLGADEARALEQSIQSHGVQHPISIDEEGNILDGHHRKALCVKLGMDCPVTVINTLKTEEEKIRFVLTMNLGRRNLTPAEKAELWSKLRLLGMSISQIAEQTNAPASSVGWALRRIADQRKAAGLEPLTEIVVGKDGKCRLASGTKKEKPAPKPVAAPTNVIPTAEVPAGSTVVNGYVVQAASNSASMGDTASKRDPVAAGIVKPIANLAPPSTLFGTILANYTEEQVFDLFCLLEDYLSNKGADVSENPIEVEEEEG